MTYRSILTLNQYEPCRIADCNYCTKQKQLIDSGAKCEQMQEQYKGTIYIIRSEALLERIVLQDRQEYSHHAVLNMIMIQTNFW